MDELQQVFLLELHPFLKARVLSFSITHIIIDGGSHLTLSLHVNELLSFLSHFI